MGENLDVGDKVRGSSPLQMLKMACLCLNVAHFDMAHFRTFVQLFEIPSIRTNIVKSFEQPFAK